MKLTSLSGLVLILLIVSACSKDDDKVSCDTSDITYTNTISAIFNSSCAYAGCHVDGNQAIAFFSLEGYANSKASADFGRIVGSVSHEMNFSPMPKGQDKLDDCTISQITAWIDAGAPE